MTAPTLKARFTRVAGRFGDQVRAERRQLTLGLAGMIGVAVAELARPWPLKLVFDYLLLGRAGEGPWTGLAAWMQAHTIAALVAAGGAVVGIAVLHGALLSLQTLSLATAAQNVVFNVRARLYAHLQTLALDGPGVPGTGDLLTRLTQDIVILRDMLSFSLVTLGNGLLAVAGTAAVLIWMDPVVGLSALVVLPALAWTAAHLGGQIRAATEAERDGEGRIAAAVHDTLTGMPAVQAFTREDEEDRRFARRSRRTLRAGLRARRLELALSHLGRVLTGAGVAVVVGLGAARVLSGAMTPGDLLVVLSYVTTAYRPMLRSARMLGRLARALAAGERVAEVLELEPRITDRPGAAPVTEPFRGLIEFRGVSCGYGNGAPPALSELSFRVEAGELVALVGATGAGKSTVLRLLLRFLDPQAGQVLIDGRDLRTMTVASLRRQLSPVLQESLLFGMTVHENIAFGRPKASRRQVAEAARRAGVHREIEALAEGYDTRIAERGRTLSGGQRRRVAIARAVLRKSRILLLDEPGAGLDALTEARVAAALERLRRGRTALVVAHNLAAVLAADRVLLLDGGRLAAAGSHDELLASAPAYRRLCDVQFGGRPDVQGGGRRAGRLAVATTVAAEAPRQ